MKSVKPKPDTSGTLIAFNPAAWLSIGLSVIGVGIAALTKSGAGFTPRVPTIDALAGLAVAAFVVDRLVTFIPPVPASKVKGTRQNDIDVLRWGWGALIGGLFVTATGLQGVKALSGVSIDTHVDRAITVLAIAGGVSGLARVKNALNPPTNAPSTAEDAGRAVTDDDLPGLATYGIGLLLLGAAAAIAALCHGDPKGLELLGKDPQDDGTLAFVVHFGPVILAAVAIEQLMERSFGAAITGPGKKILMGGISVVLAVIAARAMDLYLLHDLGFFHTVGTGAKSLNAALGASTAIERWFDVCVTGLVIAAGTAPLHDLSTALKKTKQT